MDGLGWLLVFLLPLIFVQRLLHREIQAVFILLTRRSEISLVLFSLLFLPGVFLHEISHLVMAFLLRVRTGKFSLIPRSLPNGRLQLGYVETSATDFIRDAMIGFAPLLSGVSFVAYVGLKYLSIPVLWNSVFVQGTIQFSDGLKDLIMQPDFWLWFYLIFTISSTMMPSNSDRRAWLPLGIMLGVLLAISLFAGAGPWMAEHLILPVSRILQSIAMVFAISLSAHLVLIFPVWLLHKAISKATGLEVV
jgi:hypothetical protein